MIVDHEVNFAVDSPDHPFRGRLKKSWGPAFAVARYIHSLGQRGVYISPYRVRPSYAEREGYGDDYDVLVSKIGGDGWTAVEVKGGSRHFTCMADFPYPVILLDRAEKVERCRPFGYFIVSDDCKHAARVLWSTNPHWVKATRRDSTQGGREFTAYECPKEHADFVSLEV